MSHDLLAQPLVLPRGPAWPNRFMLAPLTNQQSQADGTLGDDEYNWLVKRAEGGFGMVMTAAAHVQRVGQGFVGQIGIFGDEHIPGLTRLADGIRKHGAVSSVQLHHAGYRSDKAVVPHPVAPSDHAESGARGLSTDEVERLRDDFIAAARRAEKAGFDGVEVHGAHGYILAAFLSPDFNLREDRYGGSAENRARLVLEIIDGIRSTCGPQFQVGLRVSPERFGQRLMEIRELIRRVLAEGKLDYVDLSLWDVRKAPNDAEGAGRDLIDWFMDLPRGDTRVCAAGKIMSAEDCAWVLDKGCDFVAIGRAAILRHDFPRRVLADPAYVSPALPVTEQHLLDEALSPTFVHYMKNWKGFVGDPAQSPA
ncbi:NADH:flavin oxidoreductase [Novosphingobium sp. KCTC 2891]|uniref:NADH:flavin oxidoreductase n=1 Tax=Novosphingobium sp. KCTC 2891 TaxID=2989730 RepID=UPI0022228CC9|nr:NADH:flavin oxidoreductase [Novosphingobium sp. KCTC 2891]MCW1384190.1 NADH:flavin oxidoreductase [Novosphingobium sp. KCTC 2891]